MIAVTGYTGFVGQQLISEFECCQLLLLGRHPLPNFKNFLKVDLSEPNDINLNDTGYEIDVLIHSAARAHVMKERSTDSLFEYRDVNVLGTLNLARQAAEIGVKRFLFVSSVKVNGESTSLNSPFRFDDAPNPEDSYGASKADAEEGLRQIAQDTGIEVVIIRPPLVYGPGVKANFAAMMNLAKKNLPLPLGAIHNKRSLVALDNLVDLILTCIDHPKAVNQTFLVSDDHDVSTTELLTELTLAAGKKPRLLPIPSSWLKFVGRVLGKKQVIDRLYGNLQLDIEHTKKTLNWKPPISFEEGIKRCYVGEELC